MGIAILGVVMFCGGIALATSRWYLAPVLLVPLVLIVWGLRAGTDADPAGLRLRALVGSRHLEWPRITGFTAQRGRVHALLDSGRTVVLPAVTPDDLPALLRAGGQPSDLGTAGGGAPDEAADEPDDTDDDAAEDGARPGTSNRRVPR